MEEYAKLCGELEIAQASLSGVGQWVRPGRAPAPRAIDRVLVSVDALGGEAPVSDVVVEINRRYRVAVRINNTRREALRFPDLLEITGQQGRDLRLTPRGRAYARAFASAGGATTAEGATGPGV
jgi:hypothetical protein